MQDEVRYEDRTTILLIDFIVELVVTATLNQAGTALDRTIPNEFDNKSNLSI